MWAFLLYLYFLVVSTFYSEPASTNSNSSISSHSQTDNLSSNQRYQEPEQEPEQEQEQAAIISTLAATSQSGLAAMTNTQWAQLCLAAVLLFSLSGPQILAFTQGRGNRFGNVYNAQILNKLVPFFFMASYMFLLANTANPDKTSAQKLNAGERTLFFFGVFLMLSFLPANMRSKIGHGCPNFENLCVGLKDFITIKVPSLPGGQIWGPLVKTFLIAGPTYYGAQQVKSLEVNDAKKLNV